MHNCATLIDYASRRLPEIPYSYPDVGNLLHLRLAPSRGKFVLVLHWIKKNVRGDFEEM